MVIVGKFDQLRNEIMLSPPGTPIHKKAVEGMQEELESMQDLLNALKKEHYPDLLPKLKEPVVEVKNERTKASK